MNKKELLVIKNISKSFGGLKALSDISLSIYEGEIYGLIGPNGAGKTTLFNIITGLYKPDSGLFKLGNKKLVDLPTNVIVKNGISRTFQNIRLFKSMTVLENVMVGRHVRTHAGAFGAILRDKKTKKEEHLIKNHAKRLLDYVGISRFSNYLSDTLSYGDQRRLEIARALAIEPKVLALDEPAAGMNATETLNLKNLITKINKDGVTILIIEHDIKLILSICNRVAVLNYGKKIADGYPGEIKKDKRVIDAYIGA